MPFKKGHKKLGGRKKGTKNVMTEDVKNAILEAFERSGGVEYLVGIAETDPKTFCTLLGKVLPKDMNIDAKGFVKLVTNVPGSI